jgi:hypothetical protein
LQKFKICDNEIVEMINFLKMVNSTYKLFTQNTIFDNKDKTEAIRLSLYFDNLNSGRLPPRKELPCVEELRYVFKTLIELHERKIVFRPDFINVWKLKTIFNLIHHENILLPTSMEFITQLNIISSKVVNTSRYKLDKYNLNIHIENLSPYYDDDLQLEWDLNDENEIYICNDLAFGKIENYLMVFFENLNCIVCKNLLLDNLNSLSIIAKQIFEKCITIFQKNAGGIQNKYFVNERMTALMLDNLPLEYPIAHIGHIENIIEKLITILIEQV